MLEYHVSAWKCQILQDCGPENNIYTVKKNRFLIQGNKAKSRQVMHLKATLLL